MTVKELKEELNQYPDEAEVKVNEDDSKYTPSVRSFEGVVYIEGVY